MAAKTDAEATPTKTTTKAAKAPRPNVPAGYVYVTVPETYGRCEVITPEGRVNHKGGDLVVMSEKQAAAIEAQPVE